MKKPLIYVVDDNKITVKLMRKYLEVNGFEVGEAYDGVEALERVADKIPDVIVLDVMMPRMDGYETASRLKNDGKTKSIPVVIVTALNDVPNQIKAIESGADDFLSKPIEEKLLIAKVRLLSNLSFGRKREEFLRKVIISLQNNETTFKTQPIEDLLKEEGLSD
ncbi:MAG: response regulator [Candidatus Kapaibacteriales bacterium]